jgi:uncharacterized cupredoxin-like copper-binding protein
MPSFHPSRRFAAGAAAIALMGGATAAAVPALAASTKKETLSDFKITGASSAKHGSVTFKVHNSAKMEHELVVIRTKTRAAKLKVSGGEASEKGKVGDVEVAGGKTKSLKLNLKKGHYALICNIPTHYMAGMRKDFTVK